MLSFVLSALMLYSWITFDGIPPRSALQSATGKVNWVQSGKYGIEFRLEGEQKSFSYASKSNAMGLVYDTLDRSDHPVVTILYQPADPSGPIYSKDRYYGVFELAVDGKPVRTHAEIAQAWKSDEQIAAWLSVALALSGIYLARASRRLSRAT